MAAVKEDYMHELEELRTHKKIVKQHLSDEDMKQAKKKSVQATVFMPAGITKRILITAMDTISISRGMPVISR